MRTPSAGPATLLLSTVVAACAGAAVSLVVGHFSKTKDVVREEAAGRPSAAVISAPVSAADQVRLAALEARLGSLERTGQDAVAHPTAAPQPPSEAPSTVQAQAAQREAEDRDRALRRRHADEGVDPRWAPTAMTTIRKALTETASQANFTVRNVDCRTTMCVANVEWPTYPKALEEFRQVADGIPCALEVSVPPPDAPERAYQANLVMDCEDWRAEQPL
jgi:hypothetical protein